MSLVSARFRKAEPSVRRGALRPEFGLLGIGVGIMFCAYMAGSVPLPVARIPSSLLPELRWMAAAAVSIVLLVDAVTVLIVLGSSGRRRPPTILRASAARLTDVGTLLVTALASSAVLLGSLLLGLALWQSFLLALLAWLPLYLSEAVWLYRHYGLYSVFATLTILQFGHLSEHLVQNLQLLATHGNLVLSRGIFGQLDIEAVHFVWNVVLWIVTGALLHRFGVRNPWLWLAYAAASIHTVEHIYIYGLYLGDPMAFRAGGANGLFAAGGLFASSLARPYLHLAYNVIEVGTFAIAFWVQTRRLQASPYMTV